DIRIGWGTFDTGSSGVIGYTSYQMSGGQFAPGTIIRVEDPGQVALTTGADGQLTYDGTQAELYQVLQHEIGHALGLADNADPNSIMYYASGTANRSLDATDTTGIKALYSSESTSPGQASGPSGDPTLDRLIQAMASLPFDSPSVTSAPPGATMHANEAPNVSVQPHMH